MARRWLKVTALLGVCVMMLGCLACCAPAQAAVSPITVKLGPQVLTFDTPPQIVNGRMLVPLRGIFEALGVQLQWQQETKTIIGTKGVNTIILRIGDRQALKNNEKIPLDVPATIVRGRTMVPLRFIAEATDAYVSWDGEHRTVHISSGAAEAPAGKVVAEGFYDPSQQLQLTAKITPRITFEVILEPGALVKAAPVKLYSDAADSYRLIADADVNTTLLAGKKGFDGARIKARYSEKSPYGNKRLAILANGNQVDNKCYLGQDALITGVRVVERDTSLKVIEASDTQWAQVQLVY